MLQKEKPTRNDKINQKHDKGLWIYFVLFQNNN